MASTRVKKEDAGARKPLTIIDLFAGVGGLTYGFYHSDRYKIVAANEILPSMAKAYSINHPDVRVYCDDIKNITYSIIKKDLGLDGGVDIIVAGPPCQAYSTVGKRLLDDPRGKLFQEYYRLLEEVRPKFFVFENVKGLLSMQKGELLKTVISLFESLGYKVKYEVLNAADYGAPQVRERVIITGSLLGNEFKYPVSTHGAGKKPYITLGEAIGDLPFTKTGETGTEYRSAPKNPFQEKMRQNAPEEISDHSVPNNNPNLVRLMEALPDGGSPQDLPKELRPKSGYKNTYCRLWWDRPSTTITRNLGTPSSSRCIHPKVARALTTREGARLQCFPDDFKFYGSRTDRNLQIGNAVPTMLSTALAEAISEHFDGSSIR
jgi:DNA (cytosine-5)-methyltransferase 1